MSTDLLIWLESNRYVSFSPRLLQRTREDLPFDSLLEELIGLKWIAFDNQRDKLRYVITPAGLLQSQHKRKELLQLNENDLAFIAREKTDDVLQMFGFRVQPCPCSLNKSAGQVCFGYHDLSERRRVPHARSSLNSLSSSHNSDNFRSWKYAPLICKYTKNGICPRGEACEYAHNESEINYHPLRFKSKACSFFASNASCTSKYCSFAHDAQRHLSFTSTPKQKSNSNSNPNVQMQNQNDAKSADQLQKKRDKYVYFYKTLLCFWYKTNSCNSLERSCNGFHDETKRRRDPRIFTYDYIPCSHVKKGEEWLDSAKCPEGDDCAFSHTLLEVMYHPLNYCSEMCSKGQFSKGSVVKCPWGDACAHAHSHEELRFSEMAIERERQRRNIPFSFPKKQNQNQNQERNHKRSCSSPSSSGFALPFSSSSPVSSISPSIHSPSSFPYGKKLAFHPSFEPEPSPLSSFSSSSGGYNSFAMATPIRHSNQASNQPSPHFLEPSKRSYDGSASGPGSPLLHSPNPMQAPMDFMQVQYPTPTNVSSPTSYYANLNKPNNSMNCNQCINHMAKYNVLLAEYEKLKQENYHLYRAAYQTKQ